MSEMSANQKTALLVIALSSFIMPMMLASVNVALPSIAQALEAQALYLSWVSNAYLLASAVCLLPFGRLADMVGRKKIFLSGMLLVSLASLLAATSQSILQLIGWRILQGVGAAMLFSTGVAILSSVFPANKRGHAIGVTVSAVYFGLACGPMFGGWLTQHLSWRSVFLVHLPVALLVIAIAWMRLEGEWYGEKEQQFDFMGTAIYAVTIIALMSGLTLLPSPEGLVVLVLSFVGLIHFLRYETKHSHPVFAVQVFRGNRVLVFSCLAAMILYTSTFGITFLLSLYLQNIKGFTPQTTGLVMILQPLVMAFVSPHAGRLSDRIEPRYIASLGMALIACGLGLLTALGTATTLVYILPCLFLVGLGFAFFSSPNVNAIMGSVDKKYLGMAGGVLSTMRVIGQMFSMAIVTLALALFMGNSALIPENYPALLQSIRASLFTACCLCIAGTFLSLARGRMNSA